MYCRPVSHVEIGRRVEGFQHVAGQSMAHGRNTEEGEAVGTDWSALGGATPVKRRVARKSVDSSDIYLFKTEVLRALTDETRQGIIILLGKHKSLCVNDLAAHFNVSRPTVSHHLQVLKQAKVVSSVKMGKEMHYALSLRNIRRALHSLSRVIDSINRAHKEPDSFRN